MRVKIQKYKVTLVIFMTVVIILTLTIPYESFPSSLESIFNNNNNLIIINNKSCCGAAVNNTSTSSPLEVQRVVNTPSLNAYQTNKTNDRNTETFVGYQYRYNNKHKTLISYYPASIYPAGSRNGLYMYPHREEKRSKQNNNNNIKNNMLYNTLVKESSVERINSMPHPSCIADVLIRNYLLEYGVNNTDNKDNQTVPDEVKEWRKYLITGVHCHKKGYTRRRGDDIETAKEKNFTAPFSHIVLRNIIYSMGEFFYIEMPSHNNNKDNNTEREDNQNITFTHDASFSVVKGDWPQQVMETITLRRIILNKQQLNPSNNNDDISMHTAVAELRRLLRRKGLDNPREAINKNKLIPTDKNDTQNHLFHNHDEKREGNNKSVFETKTPLEKVSSLSSPKQPLHLHVPLAYWQPPADFNSQFHTLLDTTAPSMHALITVMKKTSLSEELFSKDSSNLGNIDNMNQYNLYDSLNGGAYCGKGDISSKDDESYTKHNDSNNSLFSNNNSCDGKRPNSGGALLLPATLLITSRVRRVFPNILNMKIKETSCAQVPNTAENPDLISPIVSNSNSINCINTPLGRMEQAVVGTAGVYGLQNDHAQIYLGTNIGDKNLRHPWKKKHYYVKADLPDTETRGHDDILFIDRLLVGNPTHCELAGGGPFSIEAVAQDQFIHGKKNTSRINLSPRRGNNSNLSSNGSSQEEILLGKRLKQFFDVYRECQLFVWEFRNFYLNKISGGGGHKNPINGDINSQTKSETTIKKEKQLREAMREESINDVSLLNTSSETSSSDLQRGIRMLPIIPPVYTDIVTPININSINNDNISRRYGDGIHIVIASRKGDWARKFNEEEVAAVIREHLKKKANDLLLNLQEEVSQDNNNNNNSQERKQLKELKIAQQAIYAHATVRIVKFSGYKGLKHKLLSQLAITKTTIFIGNHGANLIPSVFLRPNSGIILLSLDDPAFYPFAVLPRWLHFRDMTIDQICNRQLFGRCKWSESNNNDMWASKEHIDKVVEYVEDIITEQIERPRKFSLG